MMKVPVRLPLSPSSHHRQWIHLRWAFSGVSSFLELSWALTLSSLDEGYVQCSWLVCEGKVFPTIVWSLEGLIYHMRQLGPFLLPPYELLRIKTWCAFYHCHHSQLPARNQTAQDKTPGQNPSPPNTFTGWASQSTGHTCWHSWVPERGSAQCRPWKQLWDLVAL